MTRTADRLAREIDADPDGWLLDRDGFEQMPRMDVWFHLFEDTCSRIWPFENFPGWGEVVGQLIKIALFVPLFLIATVIGFAMLFIIPGCLVMGVGFLLKLVTAGSVDLVEEFVWWGGIPLTLLFAFVLAQHSLGGALYKEVDSRRRKFIIDGELVDLDAED